MFSHQPHFYPLPGECVFVFLHRGRPQSRANSVFGFCQPNNLDRRLRLLLLLNLLLLDRNHGNFFSPNANTTNAPTRGKPAGFRGLWHVDCVCQCCSSSVNIIWWQGCVDEFLHKAGEFSTRKKWVGKCLNLVRVIYYYTCFIFCIFLYTQYVDTSI